jgi:sRNA-binding regulator protein Hfq
MKTPPKALTEQLYLDHLVAAGRPCNIFLNSGIKILGVIAAHSANDHAIWLQSESGSEDDWDMYFLHNVSTISPVKDRCFTHGALTKFNGTQKVRAV